MSLFKQTNIVAAEDQALAALLRSFERSHKRHLVDYDDEELIMSDDGANLSAVNYDARLCWAKAICRQLQEFFQYDAQTREIDRDLRFVTLVDIGAMRSSEKYGVDLAPLKRLLRSGIRGHNYIGVIEPALYGYINFHDSNVGRSKGICWHLHVLFWGLSPRETKELFDRLNAAGVYKAIAPEFTGADERGVYDLAGAVAYILKPPKHAYRLGRDSRAAERGEVRHIQYSGALRPGERLTLFLQMKHLRCADLWLSGGEGSAILAAARRRANSGLRRLERLADRQPLYGIAR